MNALMRDCKEATKKTKLLHESLLAVIYSNDEDKEAAALKEVEKNLKAIYRFARLHRHTKVKT